MKKLLIVFMAISMFGCSTTEDPDPIIPDIEVDKPDEVIENKEQGVKVETLLNGASLKMNYILYSEWDSLSKYDMKTQYSQFFKSEKNKKIILIQDVDDYTFNIEEGKYLLQVGQVPAPYMFSLIEFEVKKDEITSLKKDFGGNEFENENSSNYVKW